MLGLRFYGICLVYIRYWLWFRCFSVNFCVFEVVCLIKAGLRGGFIRDLGVWV